MSISQKLHDSLLGWLTGVLGSPGSGEAAPIVDSPWEPALVADETADDSDKTIVVTAGEIWQLLWIWLEFTTTATVGDRQLVVEIQDDSNDVVAQIRLGATQAASLTRYYMIGPALADMVSFRDTDWLMTPLPPTMILLPGYQVRIYDNNAVDASDDDLIIQMGYGYKAQ